MTYRSIELNHEDPSAPQPSRIKMQLKPHQSVALAKALQMERTGMIQYELEGTTRFGSVFNLRTNVGIIGDIVGYGKTLIATSIIAENPLSLSLKIHIRYVLIIHRHLISF